ncbi:MAG TPA: serine/threonine-protein kinase [Myxococcaceae bacterium]|jgi:serine/threonine-protein kinase
MTTDVLHPDDLQPGQWVGPWRILESLGTGGFGRTFKTEREGSLFSLKMAVRPAASGPEIDGRLTHEAAALMANGSHPNLPRIHAVGRWPNPTTGYLYFVTDYVEGETFHDWRARTRPNASQLVDTFLAVTLALAELHRRELLHRDLSGSNIVIRKEDGLPIFIDLSSVWLPGASTLTQKLPPSLMHTLPPECVAFLRRTAEQEDERFDAGESGDLYQVGVFFYEALTECHPFDPKKLQPTELLAAIETIVPRAPHRINPLIPEPLSRITMKLLEKRPEERYPSAIALSQALWDVAKERARRDWKVPMVLPESGPAPVSPEELDEQQAWQQESERKAREAPRESLEEAPRQQLMRKLAVATQDLEAALLTAEKSQLPRQRSKWRRAALIACALLLCVGSYAAWWAWSVSAEPISPAPFEKGSPSVLDPSSEDSSHEAPRASARRRLAVMLCTATGLACSAAQIKPAPVSERCPDDAFAAMFDKHGPLQITPGSDLLAIIDVNQPGEASETGVYRDGPVVGRLTLGAGKLPEGTLLYGRLWTGPGVTMVGDTSTEAVMARYTEALLPDGSKFPVCIVLNAPREARWPKLPGSKPGAALLPRELPVSATDFWP